MTSVFQAPGLDHDRCSADANCYAEALCAVRALRLTAPRRHVLEALAASHKPLGAYEIMCETCGAVGEASTAAIGQLLAAAAEKAGFEPVMSVIEISGICSLCH